jgi:hypothetical protein
MTDPIRLNLPSASSFALDALCSGRQQLLQSLTDTPEVKDEDAERGIKLHKAWQNEANRHPTYLPLEIGLDEEDVEIYEKGLKLVKAFLEQWCADTGIKQEDIQERKREERFYYHDEQGNLAASGQADRHYYASINGVRYAAIVDFKSLWCRNLVPSELNKQAQLLSVLVAREYGAATVRFSFLQAMMGKSDTVDYNGSDLARAEWSIQQTLWESRQPEAQRRAGSHCRHCKANAACPEAASWTQLPTVQIIGRSTAAITPKIAKELAEQLSLHDCVRIWETQTPRRNIEDAIKARLKRQPEERLAELGLKFGESKILRPITDSQRAFEFLLSMGVPAEKLWAVTKMGNGELTDVVAESLGKTKKDAQEWIRNSLASCITSEATERPLVKI